VDATLIVAGDGPSAGAARAAATDAGLDDRVHFVGEVADEERAAYYHAADVFVLPSVSRGESFGIALLEAMACGTPVVSTELGTGTSWVNEHGSTGLVVPPGDAPGIASALRSLLADDARRAAMGAAGVERVRRHFTSDQMLAALRNLYVGAAQAR
jgi:rhamnosyl/mannosyltransferase